MVEVVRERASLGYHGITDIKQGEATAVISSVEAVDSKKPRLYFEIPSAGTRHGALCRMTGHSAPGPRDQIGALTN